LTRVPQLVAALLLVGSCGPDKGLVVVRTGPPVDAVPALALAPAVALVDVPGAVQRDAFHDNLVVGSIWLSGGYELLAEEDHQARSVDLEFDDEDTYRRQALDWADRSLSAALESTGLPWVRLEAPVRLPAPQRSVIRGSSEGDGDDDQNLPRFHLQPGPLDPADLADLDASWVLQPVVVHYYAHNGGWFVGQERGCPAGARARVLWSLHDVSTGQIRTWGEVEARYLEPYEYSPNRAELQDYLIEVETLAAEALAEQLEQSLGP